MAKVKVNQKWCYLVWHSQCCTPAQIIMSTWSFFLHATFKSVHALHGVSVSLLWFSRIDYISESCNMHSSCFSMISHAVDGWPHLRHPCVGISGSLSGLSIIPPVVEDTAELSPAVYSPSVLPPCPPLLAWSLWVFQPAMMALFHGLADGWPMTSYLGVDAVVYVSAWWGRKWHLWS